jgi:hypothetical protein
METSLMTFGRKAAIAVAAFATVGSTLFGGAALAGDDWNGHGKGGHGKGGHPGNDDKKTVKVLKAGDAKGGDGVACVTDQKGLVNVNAANVLSGILWGTADACQASGGPAKGGDVEIGH